jgi:zinc D-Ala-D-Ala carboxypeptidase
VRVRPRRPVIAPGRSAVPRAPRPLVALIGGTLSVLLVIGAGTVGQLTAEAAPAVPTAAADETPSAKQVANSKRKVERLRAKIRKTDEAVAEQTAAWEASQARLRTATDEHTRVEKAAVAARAEAARAHVDLGKFAAAAYRGQSLPTEIVMLVAPPANVGDTLHGLQTLEHSGQVKVDIATFAAQSAARAQELTAQAAALRDANARATYELDVARGEMIGTMRATQQRLAQQVERLADLELRRLSADCVAKAKVAAEFPNGMIPPRALCSIDVGAFLLRGDAAVAFKRLAAAYEKDLDTSVCVTSAYRTRALQTQLFADDPIMVAAPGRSQHGLGLALDLCGGIQDFSSDEHAWMKENAPRFGWFHPDWAEPDGVTPEPWHWEFSPELLAAMTADAAKVAKAEKNANTAKRGKAAKSAAQSRR